MNFLTRFGLERSRFTIAIMAGLIVFGLALYPNFPKREDPVVVRLENSAPGLNAGMSVEVAIEEPLIGGGNGFLLPLTVLAPEGEKDVRGVATVFVYDDATSTVKKRQITVGGIRGNDLVVTGGVKAGDLVASAGVSYLVDDERVKLLATPE